MPRVERSTGLVRGGCCSRQSPASHCCLCGDRKRGKKPARLDGRAGLDVWRNERSQGVDSSQGASLAWPSGHQTVAPWKLQWCQGRTHRAPFKRVRGNAAAASATDAACGLARLGRGRGRGRLGAPPAPAPRGWAALGMLVTQSLGLALQPAARLLRSACRPAALV